MGMVRGPKRGILLVPGLLEAKPRAWYTLTEEQSVELITTVHILQPEGQLFPRVEEAGFVPPLNDFQQCGIQPSMATLSPLY